MSTCAGFGGPDCAQRTAKSARFASSSIPSSSPLPPTAGTIDVYGSFVLRSARPGMPHRFSMWPLPATTTIVEPGPAFSSHSATDDDMTSSQITIDV